MRIRASFSPDQKRIWLRFKYDHSWVQRIKRIPGASFVTAERGGPAWSFPLEVKTARTLHEHIGAWLTVDEELRRWGVKQVRKSKRMTKLALADTAETPGLSERHPAFAEYLRPYQRADVAFMAAQDCVNANQPGLGKTVEVIAAAIESGLSEGRHLVIAPVTSLDLVWAVEIEKWLPDHMIHTGQSPAARQGALIDAAEDGGPCWCLVNPETLRGEALEAIKKVTWSTITIDEFDRFGLSNPGTQFAKAVNSLKAERKWALSGTPLGGKPLNLWGILRWVAPADFSSKWRWAEQWLRITHNGFGKNISDDLIPGREQEFYAHHTPWMLRRLKSEVLTQLPPKEYHEVWCEMVPAQRKQYEKFKLDAEVKVDDKRIVGTSILAEQTRLKQFAFSAQQVVGNKLHPTDKSGKLQALLMNLQRHGVDRSPADSGEWAVVGSQFTTVCNFVHEWLAEQGIPCDLITGETPKRERTEIIKAFQSGQGARVIVINTMAGGVSINLDIADSMHILDRTWNPDREEQLEDRIHRGSRNHQCHIYHYSTRRTIDEEVAKVGGVKAYTNKLLLDDRRDALR